MELYDNSKTTYAIVSASVIKMKVWGVYVLGCFRTFIIIYSLFYANSMAILKKIYSYNLIAILTLTKHNKTKYI